MAIKGTATTIINALMPQTEYTWDGQPFTARSRYLHGRVYMIRDSHLCLHCFPTLKALARFLVLETTSRATTQFHYAVALGAHWERLWNGYTFDSTVW